MKNTRTFQTAEIVRNWRFAVKFAPDHSVPGIQMLRALRASLELTTGLDADFTMLGKIVDYIPSGTGGGGGGGWDEVRVNPEDSADGIAGGGGGGG